MGVKDLLRGIANLGRPSQPSRAQLAAQRIGTRQLGSQTVPSPPPQEPQADEVKMIDQKIAQLKLEAFQRIREGDQTSSQARLQAEDYVRSRIDPQIDYLMRAKDKGATYQQAVAYMSAKEGAREAGTIARREAIEQAKELESKGYQVTYQQAGTQMVPVRAVPPEEITAQELRAPQQTALRDRGYMDEDVAIATGRLGTFDPDTGEKVTVLSTMTPEEQARVTEIASEKMGYPGITPVYGEFEENVQYATTDTNLFGEPIQMSGAKYVQLGRDVALSERAYMKGLPT